MFINKIPSRQKPRKISSVGLRSSGATGVATVGVMAVGVIATGTGGVLSGVLLFGVVPGDAGDSSTPHCRARFFVNDVLRAECRRENKEVFLLPPTSYILPSYNSSSFSIRY